MVCCYLCGKKEQIHTYILCTKASVRKATQKTVNSGRVQGGVLWLGTAVGGRNSLYFFLCLLNLHQAYNLLMAKYSKDKKEELSLALHL